MNYGDLRALYRLVLDNGARIYEIVKALFGSCRLHLAGALIALPETSKGTRPNVLAH